MAIITLNYVFTVGQTIIASQHNTNFSVIYSDYNGNITDANIASNAAIEYSKLALNNTIKSSDLLSTTIISASNLPVGTAVGDIVQLVAGTTPQLPAVGASKLIGVASAVSGLLGSWTILTSGTTYNASTDGFAIAHGTGTNTNSVLTGISDNNPTPSTVRAIQACASSYSPYGTIIFPVRKNDYWTVSLTSTFSSTTVYWIPLGS